MPLAWTCLSQSLCNTNWKSIPLKLMIHLQQFTTGYLKLGYLQTNIDFIINLPAEGIDQKDWNNLLWNNFQLKQE